MLPLDQNRPLDEIRILGHQGDRFRPRRRRLFHISLAIELVTRIQKQLVIAIPNQLIQLLLAQTAIQIDLLEGRSSLAKKTLRVAASGSSGLQVKFHTYRGTAGSISRLQRSMPPSMLLDRSTPRSRSQLTTCRLRIP